MSTRNAERRKSFPHEKRSPLLAFVRQHADSNDSLRLMLEHRWTLTAASYVRAMHWPALPEFPVDAEILDSIPPPLRDDASLPGNLEELLAQSERK
jgi:hypothetical protein